MRRHQEIELSTLQYTSLSDVIDLLTINISSDDIIRCALDCFTDSVCFTATRTNDVTSVVYWFELTLADGVTLCTRDSEISSHWLQAAVMFFNEFHVVADHRYIIKAHCTADTGYLDFTLSEQE